MERATTSLPTPLSPRRRTVVLVTATLATRSRIGCILLLVHVTIRESVIKFSSFFTSAMHFRACSMHETAGDMPIVFPLSVSSDYKQLFGICLLIPGQYCTKFTSH